MQLHAAVAVQKTVKARTYKDLSALLKRVKKPVLFNGFSKTFQSLDEDGETFPNESNLVQLEARNVLREMTKQWTEAFDAEITLEAGNQCARADIEVDGAAIATDVPIGFIFYLLKQLQDIRTCIEAIPTLDPAKQWERDPNGYLYRTEPVRTHKTKKIQKRVVLYEATDKHPAQVKLVPEDALIGHWITTHMSGALPVPQKEGMLERIDKLIIAVKEARARANSIEVDKKKVGASIFAYIVG